MKITFCNLCMLTDGEYVLVERKNDPNFSGVIFPGGHVEPYESFTDAVIREFREETGLTPHAPKLIGIKQYAYRDGGRYVVLLYKADSYEGSLKSSSEGEVFWVKRDALSSEALAPRFEELLGAFFSDTPKEYYYKETDGNFLLEIK